jgi:hypothetical protein
MSSTYTDPIAHADIKAFARVAGRRPPIPHRPIDAKPGTLAGLHLSRRYRVRPAIADLIAAIASLGSAVDR